MSRDDGVLLDILNAARLAEAAKRLSPGFRGAHPDIPWKSIAGLHDVLVHEYDTVDLDEVWRTVQSDLPKLIAFAERLLPGTP